MKETIKHIRADKIIKWALYSSLFLLFLQIVLILIIYTSLPPVIPLFNQLPWGEARLGSRMEIFLPIIIVFAFFIVNFLLLAKLYERLPLVSRIIGITMMLITLLSFIFTIRTIYLIM